VRHKLENGTTIPRLNDPGRAVLSALTKTGARVDSNSDRNEDGRLRTQERSKSLEISGILMPAIVGEQALGVLPIRQGSKPLLRSEDERSYDLLERVGLLKLRRVS
jgi:hypothetical protein